MNLLEKTKRNHGLEHASISLLMPYLLRSKVVAGYSVSSGFLILAKIDTDFVESAVNEALNRVNQGDKTLVISDHCGTNILVGALITTIVSMASFKTKRKRGSFFRSLSLSTLGLVFSVPLGKVVQKKYTTSADLSTLSVIKVSRIDFLNLTFHWVQTKFE